MLSDVSSATVQVACTSRMHLFNTCLPYPSIRQHNGVYKKSDRINCDIVNTSMARAPQMLNHLAAMHENKNEGSMSHCKVHSTFPRTLTIYIPNMVNRTIFVFSNMIFWLFTVGTCPYSQTIARLPSLHDSWNRRFPNCTQKHQMQERPTRGNKSHQNFGRHSTIW